MQYHERAKMTCHEAIALYACTICWPSQRLCHKGKMNVKCLLLVLTGEASGFGCCTLLERTVLFLSLDGGSWKAYSSISEMHAGGCGEGLWKKSSPDQRGRA